MKRFSGKTAIVTGGAQGIGAEIALSLSREGSSVVLADISKSGMSTVRSQIEKMGMSCLCVRTDVTKRDDVNTLIEQAVERFGTVDILVNNAGTILPAPFLTFSEKDWDFLQRVDLKGAVFCTQAVAPVMIRQNYGKIVNISSMSAFGVYMPGFASYSAAKTAVNNFTQTAARELGEKGINVNAVAPGEILTDLTYKDQTEQQVAEKLERSKKMTMIKRLGQPEDVAKSCLLSGIG